MPSDHVIGDRDAFLAAIDIGAPHADNGAIVTFGADADGGRTPNMAISKPTRHASPDGAFPIARFVEKPDAETAAEYLASGRFFWNSGIFLVKASTLLDEMRQFLPASLDAITRIGRRGRPIDGLFVRPAPELSTRAENISIDHGIMEKTSRGVVVPVRWNGRTSARGTPFGSSAPRTRMAMSARATWSVVDTSNSLLAAKAARWLPRSGSTRWR